MVVTFVMLYFRCQNDIKDEIVTLYGSLAQILGPENERFVTLLVFVFQELRLSNIASKFLVTLELCAIFRPLCTYEKRE